ncbi:hypothetical protein ACQRIT_002412 [Beauveria bassiana]
MRPVAPYFRAVWAVWAVWAVKGTPCAARGPRQNDAALALVASLLRAGFRGRLWRMEMVALDEHMSTANFNRKFWME